VLFTEEGGRNIPPGNIYNVDESGFTICQKTGKILAQKGKKSVGQLTSAEKGKTVTSVCCMSAAGVYIPPMLIFPRARLKPSLMDNAPAGAVCGANKSGWISEQLFTKWFQHFITFVSPKDRPNPVLLLMDGHSSHTCNLEIIDLAKVNNIVILVLPSHCTHRLQPLDLSFFKALNSYYSSEIVTWLRNHEGRAVGEEQVAGLFSAAYGKAATVSNAVKGFEKAGIHPFREDIFQDEDFAAASAFDRPQFADIENQTPTLTSPSLVMQVSVGTPVSTSSQSFPSEVRENFSFGCDSNENKCNISLLCNSRSTVGPIFNCITFIDCGIIPDYCR
jgi:DDE superfamily endonuclease